MPRRPAALWAIALLPLGLPLRAESVFRPAAPRPLLPGAAILRPPAAFRPLDLPSPHGRGRGEGWPGDARSAASEATAGRIVARRLAPLADLAAELSDPGPAASRDLPARLDAAFDGASGETPADSGPRPVVPPAPTSRSGRALLEALHRRTGEGFIQHGYDHARREMFSRVDNVSVHGVRGVMDAYSGLFVAGTGDDGRDYPERGDRNGDGTVDRRGMNAEHLWPKFFFGGRSPMRSDLHHLLPTFISENWMRSALPFGEVRGRPEYWNRGGAKAGGGVFEPPDAMKGRIARAMFYFYARYHDRRIDRGDFSEDFWNARIAMFLRWNREHPPDPAERERNDGVAAFQGNRNPFVDDPALADRIGVAGFRHDAGKGRSRKWRPRDARRNSFRHPRRNRHHFRRRR